MNEKKICGQCEETITGSYYNIDMTDTAWEKQVVTECLCAKCVSQMSARDLISFMCIKITAKDMLEYFFNFKEEGKEND